MVYQIDIKGEIGVDFTMNMLLTELHKAKESTTLNLAFDSPGGYCDIADAMIEKILATGKAITTCNTGQVCSAASKMFMIGITRTYYKERGRFLIHNPWAELAGDASELEKASKELKSIEKDYIKFYSQHTGVSEDIIAGLMRENIALTPEQVEEFGFAVLGQSIQAVAKLTNTHNKMTETDKAELTGIKALLVEIKGLFSNSPKAIVLQDVNGTELEFPEINDAAAVTVGVKVLQGGSPANGEFLQTDGTTIVCVDGLVTEIKEAEEEPTGPTEEEMLQLTEANTALTAENERLTSELASVSAKVTVLADKVVRFEALVTNGKPADQNGNAEPTDKKAQFKNFINNKK